MTLLSDVCNSCRIQLAKWFIYFSCCYLIIYLMGLFTRWESTLIFEFKQRKMCFPFLKCASCKYGIAHSRNVSSIPSLQICFIFKILRVSFDNLLCKLKPNVWNSWENTWVWFSIALTHWGLVTKWRRRSWSTLVQVMVCCLTAPSHYLNQCWLIISNVLWHSSEDTIIRRFEDTNHKSKVEDYIFKITLRSPYLRLIGPGNGLGPLLLTKISLVSASIIKCGMKLLIHS